MKHILLLLALGMFLTCRIQAQENTPPPPPPPSDSQDTSDATSKNGPPPGGPLTPAEREELRAAHDAALKSDPDLATEGKELMEKMREYRKKLEAAMIEADPKVAPLLAKMPPHHPPGDESDGPPPSGNE